LFSYFWNVVRSFSGFLCSGFWGGGFWFLNYRNGFIIVKNISHYIYVSLLYSPVLIFDRAMGLGLDLGIVKVVLF
jgi:hypothetical protein